MRFLVLDEISAELIAGYASGGPIFSLAREKIGKKRVLGRVWCILRCDSGRNLIYRYYEHTYSPYGRYGTRRLLRYIRFVNSCDSISAVKTPFVQNLQGSTDSPKISVKSTYSAGGQSRPPLQGELRLAVGADDSVGPLGSCKFAKQFCKKQVQTAGSMCTGKRQTHIRNAPSPRTAVTGIDPCEAYKYSARRFELFQISRERSKKTEAVFLVQGGSGGKSKSHRARFLLEKQKKKWNRSR